MVLGCMPLMVADLEIEEVGEDVLVHDPAKQKIHLLNYTAGQVLRACDGTSSIRSVAERLDVTRVSEVERDIADVLEDFTKLGLVNA